MPVDTFSATLGWLVMGTGNDNNNWGVNHNASVSQVFEDAIANIATFTDTSGTRDLSGTPLVLFFPWRRRKPDGK